MTDEPNAPLTNYWLSWYNRRTDPAFRLDWPWWATGNRSGGAVTICAAVRAKSEAEAWVIVIVSHVQKVDLDTRFCEAQPSDWTPFCDRFQRAEWMQWPVVEPPDALAAATARAEKAEAKYDQMVACAKKQKSDAVAWHAAYQAKCGELSAAQEREAKLREFCEASVWLYPYQVLKTLDKGGE